jgi:hypothetical protein
MASGAVGFVSVIVTVTVTLTAVKVVHVHHRTSKAAAPRMNAAVTVNTEIETSIACTTKAAAKVCDMHV